MKGERGGERYSTATATEEAGGNLGQCFRRLGRGRARGSCALFRHALDHLQARQAEQEEGRKVSVIDSHSMETPGQNVDTTALEHQ